MQKYTIVKFLEPVDSGAEFDMTEWPLHITLADDFELDYPNSNLMEHLEALVSSQTPIKVVAENDTYLGEFAQILVTLVDTNVDLTRLHKEMVSILKRCGAVFYNPHFIIGGYKPHVTVQRSKRVRRSDVMTIDELSIVDMNPGGDQSRRKIIKTIKFGLPTGA